jgi:transposase-like protein
MDTSRQVPDVLTGKSESLSTPPRQRRSIADKRRIVEETLAEGASVARVARAHGINANQVFGWRRLYLAGRLGDPKPGMKLLPVRVSENADEQSGNSDFQRSFSNHFCAALQVMFRTLSVVIRLAFEISKAILSPAALLGSVPSSDMIELAATVKRRASSSLSK